MNLPTHLESSHDKDKFIMKEALNMSTMFDPDQAVLPILIAQWDDEPINAHIVYQNNVLSDKIGIWKNKSLAEFLEHLCKGDGNKLLSKLIDDGELSFPCKTIDMDIKYHSFLGSDHIQITISDITEINRLRDIEQRSKLIDSFLMIGSHELKTPLNGILGITSLLKEEETDREKLDLLDMIINAASTLDGVVVKMLKQIYSTNTNQIVNAIENVNVGETINKSLPIFSKWFEGRTFSMSNVQLSDSLKIQLPEGNLVDILFEIAINIRRNTPPKGKISIETFDKDNEVHIIFKNEGFGIPTLELGKVFEPFYLHQNKLNHSSGYEFGQSGVGMGLTILKRHIDYAGGKVWFENMLPYKEGTPNTVKMSVVLPGKQSF